MQMTKVVWINVLNKTFFYFTVNELLTAYLGHKSTFRKNQEMKSVYCKDT